MRTRFFNRMTHEDIAAYTKRNDIIFVAVGTVEIHGRYPVNVETVTPEAVASLMAEKVDGLVLGDLPYFFPGASPIASSTISMSVNDGYQYLKKIAHSLLQQGFRRQIYLSSHGPAFLTIGSLVVDFFDETKVPISYIDIINAVDYVADHYDIKPDSYEDLFLGAYEVLNIKDQLVVDPDINWEEKATSDTSIDKFDHMQRYAHPSGSVGFYFAKPEDHAGMTGCFKTIAERDAACAKGAKYLRAMVDHMDLEGYVEALREIDDETADVIIPQYAAFLPNNKYPYRPRKK